MGVHSLTLSCTPESIKCDSQVHFWLTPLQALTLVVSLRLRLQHNRFGAPAEVLINLGTKFHGEFQELCEKTLIDHHTTSRDHLEVDRLAKRMVQTVKWGLRSMVFIRAILEIGTTMASYGV